MPLLHTDSLYENELSRLRESVLLMGAKAEPRFAFIQERAEFAQELDI